ncbi:MAG: trypsin-like peptidase domain-containing protein [Erythrobacter sp.]
MRFYLAPFILFIVLVTGIGPARADAGDIAAAARGVVRVVLVGRDGDQLVPVTHGTGFAVTPTRIVTNAHVLREATQDDTLRIGIVPSQGEASAYARIIALSPRNDLALIEITGSNLRVPPLALAGGQDAAAMGEVVAVGYPMNVDLAQGLSIGDIFRAQPPVNSRGFLSGERPSRQFDTILHTAPIARGNSGGPLLDSCGRVLGVNSFSADGNSGGGGADFYFAVSLRELLPFLRANGVDPQVNTLPCRSIDELNAEERLRLDAARAEARERLAQRAAQMREIREDARIAAQMEVLEQRENAMALAFVLVLASLGSFYAAARLKRDEARRTQAMLAAGLGAATLIGALVIWGTRPGIAEIEEQVAAALAAAGTGEDTTASDDAPPSGPAEGALICTLVPERSRVTAARTDDVALEWSADGCVNDRTQYGRTNQGEWSRVFVPDDEDAVAVNTFDPEARIFRTERYLLGQRAMAAAREARGRYTPPACGVSDASRLLGEQQSALLAMLPDRPNERLVYACAKRP